MRILSRPAPSAARTASSRRRDVARASSRLATFAHAVSSSTTTAARSSRSGVVTSPTRAVASGTGRTPCVHARSLSSATDIAASRARVCAIVAPGTVRPIR